MGWRSIKLDKADIAFSLYIRLRDGKCVYCGKLGTPDKEGRCIKGLDTSHFWGRRRESVRYDPQNADTLCRYHHQYFGSNPGEYAEWKLAQLGQKEYDLLQMRAETYKKKDRKMSYLSIKALLQELLG